MTGHRNSIKNLATLVNGEVIGDDSMEINDLESIEEATEGHISFLVKSKDVEKLKSTGASAVIVPRDVRESDKTLLCVDNPYLASAIIHNHLLAQPFKPKGIHPSSHQGEGCTIGDSVTIEPCVVLGDNVRVGENVFIGAGVYIGDNCSIGDETVIHPNVTIEFQSVIGKRVIIHAGSVIGSDGYGYAPDKAGNHVKRPQVGTVRIDDDVEIGANCCIDRATFGLTWIKSGSKIDNLVQIAHNVIVGENCLLVSQSAASGSTILGRNVVLGGKAATKGHVTLGDGVMVAAKGGVTRDLPAGSVVGGFPVLPIKQWNRAATAYGKIPELRTEVRRLRKELDALQQQILDKE